MKLGWPYFLTNELEKVKNGKKMTVKYQKKITV